MTFCSPHGRHQGAAAYDHACCAPSSEQNVWRVDGTVFTAFDYCSDNGYDIIRGRRGWHAVAMVVSSALSPEQNVWCVDGTVLCLLMSVFSVCWNSCRYKVDWLAKKWAPKKFSPNWVSKDQQEFRICYWIGCRELLLLKKTINYRARSRPLVLSSKLCSTSLIVWVN